MDKEFIIGFAVYENCHILGEEEETVIAGSKEEALAKAQEIASAHEEEAEATKGGDWWYEIIDVCEN